jgi:hypothetical protein
MAGEVVAKILFKSIYQPAEAFRDLSQQQPDPLKIVFTYSIWLICLPPLFAWVGAWNFGWRLGADEPIFLTTSTLSYISIGYFCLLLFGLVSTSIISRWMAVTYQANTSLGRHVALVTIIGEPLAIASVAHLFPDVIFNILVLIPTMIWSMYLLYSGIPVVLETSSDRGMLMASSLVAWLLVAAVSLLGISMAFWTSGIGPLLGV